MPKLVIPKEAWRLRNLCSVSRIRAKEREISRCARNDAWHDDSPSEMTEGGAKVAEECMNSAPRQTPPSDEPMARGIRPRQTRHSEGGLATEESLFGFSCIRAKEREISRCARNDGGWAGRRDILHGVLTTWTSPIKLHLDSASHIANKERFLLTWPASGVESVHVRPFDAFDALLRT
jgi:hypothetical protein